MQTSHVPCLTLIAMRTAKHSPTQDGACCSIRAVHVQHEWMRGNDTNL